MLGKHATEISSAKWNAEADEVKLESRMAKSKQDIWSDTTQQLREITHKLTITSRELEKVLGHVAFHLMLRR